VRCVYRRSEAEAPARIEELRHAKEEGIEFFFLHGPTEVQVDGDGNVCVATLGLQTAGITVISPTGEVLEQILTGDPLTTNICFGGPDFKTAYITLSGTGRLVSMPWPYKGLKLNY
jgi:sugar lactone lactonase YvrE